MSASPIRPSETETGPDDQAAAWFVKLLEKKISSAERTRFEAWLAEYPENAIAFSRIEAIWQEADQIAASPGIIAKRKMALSIRPQKAPRYWQRGALTGVATAAALIAFAVVLGPRFTQILVAAGWQGFVAPDHGDFATVVGERSAITLKDGSILTLDTNSAARVAYSPTERAVWLLRGQALFDVAKHQPIPFVVHAGDRRIVATGTSFDVRLEKSAVEVTLVEGHVFVDQASGQGAPVVRTELEPGERLVSRRDAPVSVAVANVARITDWRSGKLTFENERLGAAIDELNRYSNTKILVSNSRLADLRVSGVFRTGRPDDFANAVAEIYPVAIRTAEDGSLIIIPKRRP